MSAIFKTYSKDIFNFLIIPTIILSLFIFILFYKDNSTNITNIEYINNCGYTVEEKYSDLAYITIPEEFNSVFSAYNEVIREGGYDLSQYKGMLAVRYSYTVTNLPDIPKQTARINIILCKDKIISADLSIYDADGYIKAIYPTSE